MPDTAAQRLRASLAAALVAAMVGGGADLLLQAILGRLPPAGYPALVLALTGLLAVAVGAAGGLSRIGVGGTLAAWAAAAGLAAGGPLAAAGLAAATLALVPRAAAERRPARWGALVGCALAIALLGAPRLAKRLHAVEHGALAAAVAVAGHALLLAALRARELASAARRGPSALAAAAGVLAALLGLAAVVASGQEAREVPRYGPRAASEAPSVIVLVLDTARADHLSLYGYGRDTTPRLDAFVAASERAVVFPFAYAPASWTVPSHVSLLTGQLASAHGVHEGEIYQGGAIHQPPPLTAERTLAELLRARGYRTACIYANGWLGKVAGLERGFDWYVESMHALRGQLVGEWLRRHLLPRSFRSEPTESGPPAARIAADVLRFVDECGPGPCFVVANFIDAHAPYLPEAGQAQRYEPRGWPGDAGPAVVTDRPETVRLREARYDEEIRGLDAAVGDLLATLEARGVLDRSWLFVTADHGEAFGEHGASEHGTTLYDEVVRVPLLVQPPRGVSLVPHPGAVGLLDVVATIAALAGEPDFGAGRDLRALGPDHAVAIEFFGNPVKARDHGRDAARPARAVVRGVEKLLARDGREELYRIDVDAAERHDLAPARRAAVAALRPLLPVLAAAHEARPALDDEAELRALGYVE